MWSVATPAAALNCGADEVRRLPTSQVLYCAILGGVALGQAAPNIQYFVAGKAAGARLFAVLRRQPLIADQPGGSPIDKAAVKSIDRREQQAL